MRINYGYKTLAESDPYLDCMEKVMAAFSEAARPGAWLVDIMPLCMF
jgi:hypothetical protein